jgi:sugar phosphate isomerase/epimerase
VELATSLNVFFDGVVDPEQAIRRCAAAGFRALDFNYCDHQKYLLGQTWSVEEAWAQRLRAVAEDSGAHFVQMHGPMFNKFGAGGEHEALLALCGRSLQTAQILGVPWVVLEPETSAGAFDAAQHQFLLEQNAAFVRRLLPVAERGGIGIALENLPDSGARSRGARRWYGAVPEELIELVDALDHPLVGVCWDTGHAQLQALNQGQALCAIGGRLKALHIQDNDGVSDQHLLPFHGAVDWPALMGALFAISYPGAFTYEVHRAIRVLPDALRDAALRYAYAVGTFLLESRDHQA